MVIREILGTHRIEIETGGFVRFDVQLTNSPHKHDYYEICLALEGRGEYWHGGKQAVPIRPGTVFLAEPGVAHEIASFATKDLHLYFVTMSLHRLDSPLVRDLNPVLESFDDAHMIASEGHENLAHYLPLIHEPEPRRAFMAAESLRLFTIEMLNALCVRPAHTISDDSDDELAKAIAIIDRHGDRSLTVEEVAEELGVSSRTLRRRFAKSGTSAAEEINHRRMRKAAHRLLMGFTVQEVADFVGINSAAQLTRSFKRAFGVSPKQFQSSYMPGTLARRTRPERGSP